MTLHYRVVDVFTRRPLEGNPLAVFPDATGLDGDTMQRIARELCLPETTFILPPARSGCEARVRIFTPARELPFAGHPTLGTAFVLWELRAEAARGGSFRLDEPIGPVEVEIGPGIAPLFWLRMPAVSEGPRFSADRCAQALGLGTGDLLGIEPQLFSAGVPAILVPVRSRDAVDRAWLDLGAARSLRGNGAETFCVYVFAQAGDGVYARMFAPEFGISEDPATGSAMGPLATYMMRNGLLQAGGDAGFVCEQGARMGRRSVLHVKVRGPGGSNGILVGGHVTPLASATMRLEPGAPPG